MSSGSWTAADRPWWTLDGRDLVVCLVKAILSGLSKLLRASIDRDMGSWLCASTQPRAVRLLRLQVAPFSLDSEMALRWPASRALAVHLLCVREASVGGSSTTVRLGWHRAKSR